MYKIDAQTLKEITATLDEFPLIVDL